MNNANIFIKSRAETEDDCDESEFFTEGKFELTPDGYVIRYNESAEMGYENSSVAVTATPDMVVIERSGAVNSMLYIEKNKKHHCIYGTPYGDFTVGTYTYDIDCGLNENGGTLHFKYSIDINSDFISENELTLKIKLT